MEIVFIRHGQTDVNKDNRLQGAKVDAELNDYGREYAKKAAENFDESEFDAVYSSPMKRAVETAKIFTKGKKEINLDDRLLEFDFGDKPEEAEQPVDPATLEEIGVCPKCGGRVLVSPNAYVCEHTMGDKKCDFRISRTILQQEVNPEQVRLILTQGKSGLMTDFVSARTNRKFKAFLVWDAKSKKLGFEFPPREEGTKSATSKTTPRKKVS